MSTIFIYLLIWIELCVAAWSLEQKDAAYHAQQFVKALSPQQRNVTLLPFESNNRFDWSYLPGKRKGIPLSDLSNEQKELAIELLKASYSSEGAQKALDVIALEGILGQLSGNTGFRDSEKYYFTVFGAPESGKPWAWRLEGHHLSLNFTSTAIKHDTGFPTFMGANPATVPSGPKQGWQVLKEEEQLAKQLASSLSDAQMKTARIFDQVPSDILSGTGKFASFDRPLGVSFSELKEEQQELLKKLLNVYLRNQHETIYGSKLKELDQHGYNDLHFTWIGGVNAREAHYYRIHSPLILIEYDNVQNQANHIHTVVRDPSNDFGASMLMEHYRNDH